MLLSAWWDSGTKTTQFHPSILVRLAFLGLWGAGGLDPTLVVIGWEAEYTPACHSANTETDNHTHTHSHTNPESPIYPTPLG